MPRDPAERAHVRAMALTIACDIHPLNNLRVLKYLAGTLGLSQEPARRLVRALDHRGVHRAGGDRRAARRPISVRRRADPGRRLPGAANLQRAPFQRPLDAYPTLVRADAAMPNGWRRSRRAHPDHQKCSQ